MSLTKNQEKDFKKYFNWKGDTGFNPEKNKNVIENAIKKTDLIRKRKKKEYEDLVGERAEAVAMYGLSRSSKPVERYFGKKNLAYLQGKKILQKVRDEVTKFKEVN